jgi:hypothetical protein
MKLREKPINLEMLRSIRDGSGHSIFGPSGSSMWLNCPGSLIPNLLAPDKPNPDSCYGTVCHEIAETWLTIGKRPTHLLGKVRFFEYGEWGSFFRIDEEMLEHARACVDWVEFLRGERYVEQRVDFSRITPIPNQSGTADLIVIDGDTMYVIDWKFGKGVRVYAERNTQAMLYALGAMWKFDPERKIKRIIVRIGQPRLDHFDEWETTPEELLMFAGWAQARMALAWSPNAPRVAGAKQCQFCRVQASCAANALMQVELSEGVFEDLDNPVSPEQMQEFKDRLDDNLMEFDIDFIEAGNLTTEQLVKLKPFRKLADKWWHSVEHELMVRTLNGEDLTKYGHKIVEGRSIRKFTNEREAAEHLQHLGVPKEQVFETKIVSPSKAEELLIKAGHRRKDMQSLLEGYTRKPPGKPTIVPLHDKRPAMVDLTEEVFDDLDSETPEDEEI